MVTNPVNKTAPTAAELAAQLEESASNLRAVLDVAPVGIAIAMDPEATVIRANRVMAEFLGMNAEENISKRQPGGKTAPYQVLVDGVEVDASELPLQKAGATQRRVDGEYTIVRQDGSKVILAGSAEPLFDEGGKIRGSVLAMLDVTAQRRAEAALRSMEQRLSSVLDRMAEGFVLYDRDLKLIHANRTTCEAAGRPLEQLVGVTAEEALGNGNEVFTNVFRRVLETGEPAHVEAFSRFYQRWYDTDAYPHELGVAVFFRDVTARHQAEAALRDSEEKARAVAADLQAVMDAVPALTAITHRRDAQEMTTSRYGYELLRMPSGSNMSITSGHAPFRVFRHGRELVPEEMPIQAAAATGREQRAVDFTIRFEDGTSFDLFGNAVPLLDGDGQPRGAVGAFVDVTELKHAQQSAEAASAAKDALLSSVSHELRTPLTAILGWAQALRMLKDPSDLETGTAAIEAAARVQARLIEDLLDAARIGTGKLRLNIAPVRLDAVAHTSIEIIGPQARDKRVTLLSELSAVVVNGDAVRLQQIVWNLAANAVKFTPPGGTVSVIVRKRDSHAELLVEDSGEGIAPEFLSSVFDAFSQEREARPQGGLGLGLTIVKHLVEAHGGEIQVTSRGRDCGALFTVRLPAAEISTSDDKTDSVVFGEGGDIREGQRTTA